LTVLPLAALISRLAVEQTCQFIKASSSRKLEKQAIDCELIPRENAAQFGLFGRN
jgi:erythritol transport system substrate-binding protein